MEINATIIVQLAFFLSLMLWLSKLLFKPLIQLFDERELRIQGAIASAKELDEKGKDQLAYVEERMKQAQRDAREKLMALKSEAGAFQRELLKEARRKANEHMSTGKARIQSELDKARDEMKPFVEENVRLLVSRFQGPEATNAPRSTDTKMEFRSA